MNALITGGAGFIGSHLADRLLAAGRQVTVLDDLSTGRRENLPPRPGLRFLQGDVADPGAVEAAFRSARPEVVVHAAASFKDPDDWAGDCRTNLLGSAVIGRACRRFGVRRLVYLQTSLCYGIAPAPQPVRVTQALRPGATSYAISKTGAEYYLGLAGVPLVVFRLANIYGPRNYSGPLPAFFRRLTRQEPCVITDTRRDFLFVGDLVDLLLRAVSGAGAPGVYHASSGRDYPVRALYDEVRAALGLGPDRVTRPCPRGPDDAYTILIDPCETAREFGWKASTPLAEGVRAAIRDYRAHGVGEPFSHLRLPSPAPAG